MSALSREASPRASLIRRQRLLFILRIRVCVRVRVRVSALASMHAWPWICERSEFCLWAKVSQWPPPFSHSLSHTRTHARLSLSALLSLPGDRLHLTSASLCLHSALGCVPIHKELWSKLTKQCKVQNRNVGPGISRHSTLNLDEDFCKETFI